MRAKVDRARQAQAARFGEAGRVNAHMTTRQIRTYCTPDADGQDLLKTAMEELGLSAQAHDRILRVSRTVADMEGADEVRAEHVSEAIGYRSLDRRLWNR